ncbi:MAG: amino acid ABC transporter substrate-binding protein [Clostridia bacterium]|nr:amino acid ABC transporter substrate-binding protein [Clostridia bacterium]MBR6755217.1 amino acid ABC transporter substrate-binding protein [Clostridia bacterium]
MKKITALLLSVLMLAVCFVGCGAKGKTLSEVKEAGKLTIATSPDFPPFENLDADKNVVGIEVEIMNIVCEKLGVKPVFEQINFDAVLTGVQSGKYDCGMSGISVTDKRKENTLFTKEYCLAAQVIVVKSDSAIAAKADLSGKTIAVQTGTTAAEFCSGQGYTLSQYEANQDAKLALTQGKVDAWVVDDLTAAELCKGDNGVKILDEKMTTEPYAFAFAFGSEDLVEEINKILDELIADGTIKSIFDKYDAPYTKPE